jgi:hypothetical protein
MSRRAPGNGENSDSYYSFFCRALVCRLLALVNYLAAKKEIVV